MFVQKCLLELLKFIVCKQCKQRYKFRALKIHFGSTFISGSWSIIPKKHKHNSKAHIDKNKHTVLNGLRKINCMCNINITKIRYSYCITWNNILVQWTSFKWTKLDIFNFLYTIGLSKMHVHLPMIMSSICPITASNNLSDLPDLMSKYQHFQCLAFAKHNCALNAFFYIFRFFITLTVS